MINKIFSCNLSGRSKTGSFYRHGFFLALVYLFPSMGCPVSGSCSIEKPGSKSNRQIIDSIIRTFMQQYAIKIR